VIRAFSPTCRSAFTDEFASAVPTRFVTFPLGGKLQVADKQEPAEVAYSTPYTKVEQTDIFCQKFIAVFVVESQTDWFEEPVASWATMASRFPPWKANDSDPAREG
jgi:hypothetical protein